MYQNNHNYFSCLDPEKFWIGTLPRKLEQLSEAVVVKVNQKCRSVIIMFIDPWNDGITFRMHA